MADVKCQRCRGVFLETTEHYDPLKRSDGTMFRLKDKYGAKGYNWSVFPPKVYVIADALECPGCGQPLTNAQKIVVAMAEKQPLPVDVKPQQSITTVSEFICNECGKGDFKSKRALHMHKVGKHRVLVTK